MFYDKVHNVFKNDFLKFAMYLVFTLNYAYLYNFAFDFLR